jgi:tRNA A-37 threonylcarbamoyl transferase component Bud32
MQASLRSHPSDIILRLFSSGKLDDAGAEAVVVHLGACSECRARAESLAGDSFLERLRAAHSTPAPCQPLSAISPLKSEVTPTIAPELRNHEQYEVVRELGRGGMGVVYLAKNKLMDRPEVLKVVHKRYLDQPGMIERFLREIRSAAHLSHPNVVTAYAALQVGELMVFAMEYVEGEDLAKVVKLRGPLPVANACYYAKQVALGLQHAFEKGMVHRDIKPQNLILASDGKKHIVKVLDFGLAKLTRLDDETGYDLTGVGMMMGTPDYIAPEQTVDAAKADIRADIYSLGCTLHFLLIASPPFKGKSLYELLQAHHSREPTPLDQIRAEVPAELAAVVGKMMAKEPARRYQQPVEVARALAPFLKDGLKPLSAAAPGVAYAKAEAAGASTVGEPNTVASGASNREPKGETKPPVAAPRRTALMRREWSPTRPATKRAIAAVAGVAVLLVVGVVWLAATVLQVKTPQGTIELVVTEPDAEVFVDGNKIDVRVPGDQQPLQLEVDPGRPHELKVTKGSFQAFTREVTILAGKKEAIRAKLVPEKKVEPPTGAERPNEGFTSLSGGKDWEKWYVQRQINGVGNWDFASVELHGTYKQRWSNDEPILATKRDDFRDFQLQFEVKLGGPEAIFCFRDQPPRYTGAPNYPVYKGKGYGVLLADTGRVNQALAQQVAGSLLLTTTVYHNELLSAASEDRWLKGEWNTIEVTARGNSITVAVNGTKVVQFVDPEARCRRGHLSLNPAVDCDLYVRNIRLKELTPTPIEPISRPSLWTADKNFVPLFNRKDLTGWKVYPEGTGGWQVEAGLLTGRGPQSHLFSERGDYENFHLRAECRINCTGDSGLFFRSLFGPGFPVGYEAQILIGPRGNLGTGTLFEFGNSAKEIMHVETADKQIMVADTWFTQEVIAEGDHVIILVNGKKAVDEKLPSGYRTKGHLALQQFHLGTVVEFCRIEIKELPPSRPGEAK